MQLSRTLKTIIIVADICYSLNVLKGLSAVAKGDQIPKDIILVPSKQVLLAPLYVVSSLREE